MLSTRINPAGVQYVRDHLANLPRPDHEVGRSIQTWLRAQGVQLAPDQIEVVTLHIREPGSGIPLAQVIQRVSLIEAVLMNWQGESNNNVFDALFEHPWAGTLPAGKIRIVDTLPSPPIGHNGDWYRVFNGLFRRTDDSRFDSTTLLTISAETLQSHIEALDYHTQYKALLDTYWAAHLQTYGQSCKLNFIAACNKQVSEGSLSDPARRLIWRAAKLLPRGRLRLSTLSIYGYASTDLLYINDVASDLTVLYMPGNSSPLLEFASEEAMKDWIGEQCKDAGKRNALKRHFRLADGPQGIDFSGLDTALEGLGAYPARHNLPPEHGFFNDDGTWPPRTYVNYRPGKYNPKIKGDLFQALAKRQRQRTYDDADFLITSDSEVTKKRWQGYLNTTLNLVAPLTLVVPGLAPLIAIGGLAQAGLGLDQVINGKHLQDQQAGVSNLAWGLFNALPLVAQGVAKSTTLFEVKSESFVPPRRLNEQIGYPLSPISPPRLPELDAAPYFHNHSSVTPLPGADQTVADSVIRVPKYDGSLDDLDASIGGYNVRMIYDMEKNAFIIEGDENSIEPIRHVALPHSKDLEPVEGPREVTDAMRTSTLRALGIDLPLPVQLPTLAENRLPIPKTFSSLWVGGNVMDQDLIRNLANNASHLQNSEYRLRLFLSNASPAAFEENLRLLNEQAPGIQVLPLEEQAFFRSFSQSKYHAQYQAALDGNGGVARNYASAADVLRYQMLYHEGGVYIDVDDTLFMPGEIVDGKPAPAVDQVELRTTPDGLLLAPAMSNEKMGMNCLFNNSLIGSHPGNPTLEAISEEMHTRYLARPDFYDSKPSVAEDPLGFYRYAQQLSELTGPALLTQVVDQRLPGLATLRQINNLCGIPRVNSYLFVDLPQAQKLTDELLPLGRVAKVGGSNSWART
ncbi:mannosyltransferase [Pseudomonas wayambapalatensis]|nr:mannosyltransferase [Pseudomonas wayambapalatensis]